MIEIYLAVVMYGTRKAGKRQICAERESKMEYGTPGSEKSTFPDKKEKNRNNSHLQRCENLREPDKTRKGD